MSSKDVGEKLSNQVHGGYENRAQSRASLKELTQAVTVLQQRNKDKKEKLAKLNEELASSDKDWKTTTVTFPNKRQKIANIKALHESNVVTSQQAKIDVDDAETECARVKLSKDRQQRELEKLLVELRQLKLEQKSIGSLTEEQLATAETQFELKKQQLKDKATAKISEIRELQLAILESEKTRDTLAANDEEQCLKVAAAEHNLAHLGNCLLELRCKKGDTEHNIEGKLVESGNSKKKVNLLREEIKEAQLRKKELMQAKKTAEETLSAKQEAHETSKAGLAAKTLEQRELNAAKAKRVDETKANVVLNEAYMQQLIDGKAVAAANISEQTQRAESVLSDCIEANNRKLAISGRIDQINQEMEIVAAKDRDVSENIASAKESLEQKNHESSEMELLTRELELETQQLDAEFLDLEQQFGAVDTKQKDAKASVVLAALEVSQLEKALEDVMQKSFQEQKELQLGNESLVSNTRKALALLQTEQNNLNDEMQRAEQRVNDVAAAIDLTLTQIKETTAYNDALELDLLAMDEDLENRSVADCKSLAMAEIDKQMNEEKARLSIELESLEKEQEDAEATVARLEAQQAEQKNREASEKKAEANRLAEQESALASEQKRLESLAKEKKAKLERIRKEIEAAERDQKAAKKPAEAEKAAAEKAKKDEAVFAVPMAVAKKTNQKGNKKSEHVVSSGDKGRQTTGRKVAAANDVSDVSLESPLGYLIEEANAYDHVNFMDLTIAEEDFAQDSRSQQKSQQATIPPQATAPGKRDAQKQLEGFAAQAKSNVDKLRSAVGFGRRLYSPVLFDESMDVIPESPPRAMSTPAFDAPPLGIQGGKGFANVGISSSRNESASSSGSSIVAGFGLVPSKSVAKDGWNTPQGTQRPFGPIGTPGKNAFFPPAAPVRRQEPFRLGYSDLAGSKATPKAAQSGGEIFLASVKDRTTVAAATGKSVDVGKGGTGSSGSVDQVGGATSASGGMVRKFFTSGGLKPATTTFNASTMFGSAARKKNAGSGKTKK